MRATAATTFPRRHWSPRGADTPEGAVQAIFDAVDDLDLEALIADLNPNEAGALQRYAPMFIDDAQNGHRRLEHQDQLLEHQVLGQRRR